MAGKQVTELDALPSFTDTSLLPVHNGAGLKKGLLSQLASYLGTKFSNPNLLINPDFRINQRGQSSYSALSKKIYTVDRWNLYNANLNVSTKMLTNPNSSSGQFKQTLKTSLTGTYTMTVKTTSVSGNVYFFINENGTNIIDKIITTGVNTVTFTSTKGVSEVGILISNGASVQLDYAKVEQGTVATTFIAPNSAEELMKCKQFYNHIYFFHVFYSATSNFDYSFSHVVQSMRTKPTVKLSQSSSSGLSKYSASVNNSSGLTVITTATTNKVGNCNTGGIVELDAEIY